MLQEAAIATKSKTKKSFKFWPKFGLLVHLLTAVKLTSSSLSSLVSLLYAEETSWNFYKNNNII